MNQWATARSFYHRSVVAIMRAKSNEWGIDPYAWEDAGITMTPIEAWLWHDIRAADVVLYPQFPVGQYFADFANPAARVAIECDGEKFHLDAGKDARRDAYMRERGWSVYRISGKDCRDGVDMESATGTNAREFIERIAEKHRIRRAD